MIGTKVWDEEWGWGTIVAETENLIVVKWDCDPLLYAEFWKSEVEE